MKIVMLGMIGAGKGTQAKKISQYLNIPHISTGDIFRVASRSKTELGLKAEKIMKAGLLVSDDVVLGIVKERINQPDTDNGYILDGFPRTLNQAVDFEKIEDLNIVFYITVLENEVLRRLKGRRVCKFCNKEHNVYLDEDVAKCTECGERLIQRTDDKDETVKVRIKNYILQTKPLIDYYRKKSILKRIDGNQDIKKVFEGIREFI